MLRKLLLVTVAVASLSAATLAPTPASAWYGGGWGWGGGWGPGWGPGWPGLARPWLGMAPSLGLGWTALRCGTRILWRRLRRSTSGPRPVGSALDPGESVLVTEKIGGDFRTDGC